MKLSEYVAEDSLCEKKEAVEKNKGYISCFSFANVKKIKYSHVVKTC